MHISGIKLATVVEELLNIEKFNLVQPNIRVAEQLETQRMMNAGQQTLNQEEAISEEGVEAEENTEEMAMQ